MIRTEHIIRLIGPLCPAPVTMDNIRQAVKIKGRIGKAEMKKMVIKAIESGCTNSNQVAIFLGTDRTYMASLLQEMAIERVLIATEVSKRRNQIRFSYKLR